MAQRLGLRVKGTAENLTTFGQFLKCWPLLILSFFLIVRLLPSSEIACRKNPQGAFTFSPARFLEFADDLMGRKAFVQMRHIVEASSHQMCILFLSVLRSVLLLLIN